MKFIIRESQINSMDEEKKAYILSDMIDIFYPDLFIEDDDTLGHYSNVYDNKEDMEELLYYYDWERKEFYVGVHVIDKLYQKTGAPFLDYDQVNTNKMEMFDKIIKIFAKKDYGWNVDKVFFHWY